MKKIAWCSLVALLAFPTTALADYYVEARVQSDGGASVVVAWDTTAPVEYRIDAAGMPGGDGSEVDAIAEAFQSWEDVDCATIEFTQGPDVTDPVAYHWMFTSDQYIQIWWSNDPATWGASVAVGRADWVHDGTGRIIGAEIILNSKDHTWSTTGEAGKMDVQSVVTALIGKSFGITSDAEGNATYPRYRAGETDKRTLGADDIAALQYIYGDGSCTPEDPGSICDGTDPLCPPRPDTAPSDGGTSMPPDGGVPGTDAGTPVGDGGTTTTPGDDDDDGCGCRAAGATRGAGTGGWLALGLLLGLAGIRMRRRRR